MKPEESPAQSPLTPEQERIAQKVLSSHSMPAVPSPTRSQTLGNYAAVAYYCLVLGLFVGSILRVLPTLAVLAAIPLAVVMQFGVPNYLPSSTKDAKSFTRRHIRKLLAPLHGFVCLRCHYPLTALPDTGQCPECGTLYTREQTVRAWKDAYKLKDDWERS